MCLSETKIFNEDLPILPSFKIYRSDRTNKGGGVAIICNKNLNCKVISFSNSLIPFQNIECLTLSIERYFRSIIVCLIYRPKFTLTNDDMQFFKRLLTELNSYKKIFHLIGDFNIHFEDTQNTQVQKFKAMIDRNNVHILTTKPTRNNALLDCILSNDRTKTREEGVINPQLLDHACCYVKRNGKIEKPKPKTLMKKNYTNIDFQKFANKTISAQFLAHGNLDEQVDHFTKTIVDISDTVAPAQPRKVYNNTKNLVVTAETKKFMKLRDKLFRNLKNGDISLKQDYLEMKKIVRKQIINDTSGWVDKTIKQKRLWQTPSMLKPTDTKNLISFPAEEINDHFNSATNPTQPNTYSQPTEHDRSTLDMNLRFQNINTNDLHLAWKLVKTKTNPKPITLDYLTQC